MSENKGLPMIVLSKYEGNTTKIDTNNVDNIEIPMTPPARENTEDDIVLNKEADGCILCRSIAGANHTLPAGDNTHHAGAELVPLNQESGTNDHESEIENVLREMQKYVNFNQVLGGAESGIGDDKSDLTVTPRQTNSVLWKMDNLTVNTTSPRDSTGFTTRTVTELNFTWDSTLTTAQDRTYDYSENSAYTNQYLRTNASTYGNGWPKRAKKRENNGVWWSNRAETRVDGRKLFCYDQYQECQLEKSHRTPEAGDTGNLMSRNASRLALESREAMFRRAMTLLSARCSSVRQEGDGENKVTLGAQIPKYFYVTQDKPQPMEPLKAWRGYHGNIYFEPININPLHNDPDSKRAKTSVPRVPVQPRTRTSVGKPRTSKDKENRSALETRSESRLTNKSSQGSTRPLVYLDKHTVLNRMNDSIHEDIMWLEGTENTGSLAVRPKTYPEKCLKEKDRDLQYNKERIRKGSVAHKLYIDHKAKQKPKLSVSGGKFTPPNSLSPLLRTQTQYSLSSHRLTTNSPDPYHLNDSKLPPLDQIRASLKHMDNQRAAGQQRGKLPYNKTMALTADIKPFVKYSPDVMAKMAQQTNIC